jgi:hypothetical protein
MKQHILNFFIENASCTIELQELKNKYFSELKELKNVCDSCETRKIRKKYLDLLLQYDF